MNEKKYLKWYNKVGYGSGDIAGNVVYAFLSSFVMIYLTNTVAVSYTHLDVYKRQDPKDATIYYVGPTPAKPGQVIGSAGPTTSGRMDAYAPTMMSVGARGMIGKGARLPEVVDAMKKYDGVYLSLIHI